MVDALQEIRNNILKASKLSEAENVGALLKQLNISQSQRQEISDSACQVVRQIREDDRVGIMETFLSEYGLDTDEGIALMCLAEAFLRTPDAQTLDDLIYDKIGDSDWSRHLGKASSALVNASTWALMLTGKVFKTIPADTTDLATSIHGMVQRLGEPVARTAIGEAMKILGRQFVLGRTIKEAQKNSAAMEKEGYCYSYDMLGEAAITSKDAQQYFLAYMDAISEIAKKATHESVHLNPGISVKLSALHPRYETVNKARVMEELVPKVAALAQHAMAANIPLAIDAEEAERLDLSLSVIEAVLSDRGLKGWHGFGVVVQAYQKCAPSVLDWLYELAKNNDCQISVRLVKGAYWDAEIKHAQVLGVVDYPVFTRKESTDISYMVCAQKLFSMADHIFAQFATHNAHTVAAINAIAPTEARFEFQRLHGMGEALHEITNQQDKHQRRIYAPVGMHKDLLAYLVRRLLENGANSSFVNQLQDIMLDPADIIQDPVNALQSYETIAHPKIELPTNIFGSERGNSRGWNLNDPLDLKLVLSRINPWKEHFWNFGKGEQIKNPANRKDIVGAVKFDNERDAVKAIKTTNGAFVDWQQVNEHQRAEILEKAADLYEAHDGELMALMIREAGKTVFDVVSEIREAVDFLRYYANKARSDLTGRKPIGTIVCISPWNFPCAIFTGQIAAQLAAGNCVVAKPAEQTPLIAARLIELMHQAGVPENVLQLVQARGADIGPVLTGSAKIAAVVFTGSTQTASLIDVSMAGGNPNAGLLAETGGLNAMIVDSTALPEQAVKDIVASAFQSAGQRCSALRVLYVQKDVAASLLEMLEGAAREFCIGDPWNPQTDVGPVIDQTALEVIENHCNKMKAKGRLLFELAGEADVKDTTFVTPMAFQLNHISELEREIFGPVLHIIEFEAKDIDKIVEEINQTGYGLTMGIHSRIDRRVDKICQAAEVGNIYVNRNQIGAVVGVQPFGGEGLSGTGPKAGGPFYARRFTRGDEGHGLSLESCQLRGPTGERNTWSVKPRGQVLCIGSSPDKLAAIKAIVQSTGNQVVEADDERQLEDILKSSELGIVATDCKDISKLRLVLSRRQGRRILIINPFDNVEMLYSEKVICEDTTATGGNASLLSSMS